MQKVSEILKFKEKTRKIQNLAMSKVIEEPDNMSRIIKKNLHIPGDF